MLQLRHKMKDKRKTLKLPPYTHAKLREAVGLTGLTMTEYLDSIISDDLERLRAMSKTQPVRIK